MKFRPPTDDELNALVPAGTILLGYRGSVTHGTWEPEDSEFSTDDIDLMGVAIGPPEHYYGLEAFLGQRSVQEKFIGAYDAVTYELRKFVSLLIGGNPNVLPLLWINSGFYLDDNSLYMERCGEYLSDTLINNRDAFSTRQVGTAFGGYAISQFKRMQTNVCAGYMGEKRKALVARFGYDTKNAMHAIRLLRMGVEFMETEQLNVHREDAKELLDIKHGEWSLERITSEAQLLQARLEHATCHSTLPDEVDKAYVNALLVRLIEDYWEITST